jgi:uncharacterized protein (DUF1501 family)
VSQRRGHQSKRSSESIAAFYADIVADGHGSRVLIVTISEFGCRGYENVDRETDHGFGSFAFAVGDPVKGGIYGTYSSLDDDKRDSHRELHRS